MISVILIIISAVLLFLFLHLEAKWRFRCLKDIPGPKPLPIIGNSWMFKDLDNTGSLKFTSRLIREYGPITKVWLSPFFCCIIITDLDLIEIILSSPKHVHKKYNYKFFIPVMGQGLFSCTDANLWHKRRKMISPAFHLKILEQFLQVFHFQGSRLQNNLNKHVNGEVFDVFPYINAFTMDVVCDTTMTVKTNHQENLGNSYLKAVHDFFNIVTRRLFSLVKRFDISFIFTKDYQLLQKCIKVIQDHDRLIIEERKKFKAQSNDVHEKHEDEFGMKKKKTFLDVLLEARIDGQPLDDAALLEEVDTLMIAGHDTVSSTLSFAIYAIANNKEVQDKMVAELREIFQEDSERLPTMRDLADMKYIEMVIKETLRFYTTVPALGRHLQEDIMFKGTILPKGLEVVIFVHGLNQNPDVFENPEKFIPERFENTEKKHPYAFIPFSAGPRNCIGQKYAMLELKVTLAKILRKFELLPAGPGYEVETSADIIMKSTNGIYIKIQPRKF